MSAKRFIPLLLLSPILLLGLPSCGIGPFARSSTVEISLSFPDEIPPAPAGLLAAVRDELAAGGLGSRVFDPSTAFIQAVISAPDLDRPLTLTAPYAEGSVRLQMAAPVGAERLLTVTALDASRSALTRGSVSFRIESGLTRISLWMKPAEELLSADRVIGLGTGYQSIPLDGLPVGANYFYADLPADDFYVGEFLENYAIPSIHSRAAEDQPFVRLYDEDGRRLSPEARDSAYPGRFAAPAGRLYLALNKPEGGTEAGILLDLDWRPAVGGLTALGELDSRSPLVLTFPRDIEGIEFPPLTLGGTPADLSIDGKRMILTPGTGSQGRWQAPSPYAWLYGSFPDPILAEETRNLDELVQPQAVYQYVYLSPTGDDAGTGGALSPFRTLTRTEPLGGDPELRYVLAAGTYEEPYGFLKGNGARLLGGWTGAETGAWSKDESLWSTIVTGTGEYAASSSFSGDAYAEGIVFKHALIQPSGSPPPTIASTVSVSDSMGAGITLFSRCRFYSPGCLYAGVADNELSAISVSFESAGGGAVLDRCSVNWPPDEDPRTQGGLCDRRGADYSMSLHQTGIAVTGGELSVLNSIVSGGELRYEISLSDSSTEINAISIVPWGAVNATVIGSSLLSGLAPDREPYAAVANRVILSSEVPLTCINTLFVNQTSLPDSAEYDKLWGIREPGASTVASCAFVGLGTEFESYASFNGLEPGAGNAHATAVFDPTTFRPVSGSLRELAGVGLLAFAGEEGWLPDPEAPDFSFSAPYDLLFGDFHGARRETIWSIGAVEYR